MTISQIYNLNKKQPELDFIDIDPNLDTPLFLDPFFLSIRQDNWSIEATRTIKSFFQLVISLINSNDIENAKKLFTHLKEPNATCLGLSVGAPRGRGVGSGDTDDIFESLINSRAIQTGLIQDIEDSVLFIDGFGKDKLSDMTTNIIRLHLIEYTQNQCRLHGIPLAPNTPSGFFWNKRTQRWEQDYREMLVVGDKIILLVPKGVVSYSKLYTHSRYYNNFVLNFMQNEHLNMNSALVQERNDKTRFVTKKDLKERNPLTKDFLADFTQKHPQILSDFKSQTKPESLGHTDLTSNSVIREIIDHLITKLGEIPTGPSNATLYHRLITGALELIFYPHLISPTLEKEIHDGRKRIDLVFDNAAEEGIFKRFSENMQLPSQFIMVECKNYASDVTNPELDQLAGRFSPNRGKVGFILCRSINNMELFLKRCSDTYKDSRGLIIPLVDEDIILLLQNFNDFNTNFLETFLSTRVRTIALS